MERRSAAARRLAPIRAGLAASEQPSRQPFTRPPQQPGLVVGGKPDETALPNEAGEAILAAGGNAVDAAIAAALACTVVLPASCGVAGYGGSMVVALADGRTTSFNFNSTAPAAATPEMFVGKGEANTHGWLAVGVPGVMAGLAAALAGYGTRPLSAVLAPAIGLARDGWTCTPGVAEHVAATAPTLAKTPAAAALLLNGAYTTGETVTNPELAALLQRFADEESVASMYGGDVGREIAAEVQRNGPSQRPATPPDKSRLEAIRTPGPQLPRSEHRWDPGSRRHGGVRGPGGGALRLGPAGRADGAHGPADVGWHLDAASPRDAQQAGLGEPRRRSGAARGGAGGGAAAGMGERHDS